MFSIVEFFMATFSSNLKYGFLFFLLMGFGNLSFTREIIFDASEEVRELFKSKAHRNTAPRQSWVYNWVTGIESVSNSLRLEHSQMKASQEIQKKRLEFLKANWDHANFLPFEGFSIEKFINNSSTRFLVRLSTSQPGAITVTSVTCQGSLIHTRYTDLGQNIDGIIARFAGSGTCNRNSAAEYISVE